jgi:NAD(P)-dependent dehydrogenase (short-subunit alcohol dehydrogenase family)
VIGLIRSVAAEVGAAGITVNAITPSVTATPGVDAGPQRQLGLLDLIVQAQAIERQAVPEYVVGAISFLASDGAAFVSGQTLAADGGATRL